MKSTTEEQLNKILNIVSQLRINDPLEIELMNQNVIKGHLQNKIMRPRVLQIDEKPIGCTSIITCLNIITIDNNIVVIDIEDIHNINGPK